MSDGKPDPVPLKVTGAVAPLTVLVNGMPAVTAGARQSVLPTPTVRALRG